MLEDENCCSMDKSRERQRDGCDEVLRGWPYEQIHVSGGLEEAREGLLWISGKEHPRKRKQLLKRLSRVRKVSDIFKEEQRDQHGWR